MVEITKDSLDQSATSAKAVDNARTQVTPEISTSDSAESVEPIKQASKGEQLYDKAVYKGVGYWATLGLSLYLADQFLAPQAKWKPTYDKTNEIVTTALRSVGISRKFGEKALKQSVGIGVGVVTLNAGGNLLLIPLKLLEDAKRPLVHWLNKNVYKEQQLAPDGHEETPKEIFIDKEQPEQGWGRVIARRALAMGSTIVAGVALDKIGAKKLPNGETLEGAQRFTEFVERSANKVLKSGAVPHGAKIAASPVAQRYIGYAAIDTFFTMLTSSVMKVTNGAKKARVPGELGDQQDPPGVPGINEIVMLPPDTKIISATPDVVDAVNNNLEKFRTKKSSAAETHVDRLKNSDSGLSLMH